MISKWIAEATEVDFKEALETRKPKSWLKSVSAFANGAGGTLIFGVDNDHNLIGLSDVQTDAEAISCLIKERISPIPRFILTPRAEKGKSFLVLSVSPEQNTPYYKADGIREAYIRIGSESVPAPDHMLNQLLLKGANLSYDAMISPFHFGDYAFTKLRERYKIWTGRSFEEKFFDAFGIRGENGMLTNAGALMADESPIHHSRLFCTRWAGLTKSGGLVDAWDHEEFSGSLISLLNEGIAFIKRNMRTIWKKLPASRLEFPDYVERSFFEGLVNALIHRDYLILGSEVHIDIYDDRLTIYSPGGMPDGSIVQNRDITEIFSTRRNPVLADIFGRLGYMERQGTGLSKIRDAYENAANFFPGKAPKFLSDPVQFLLTLPNLNYGFSYDQEQYELFEPEVSDPAKKVPDKVTDQTKRVPDPVEKVPDKVTDQTKRVPDPVEKVPDNVISRSQKVKNREQELVDLLYENPTLNKYQIAEKMNVSRKTITIYLKRLKDKNIITRIGSDRRGYWQINPDFINIVGK